MKYETNEFGMVAFLCLNIITGIGITILGWVMNLIKIFSMEHIQFTGEVVLRIVGIFVAPLGVIMGYL